MYKNDGPLAIDFHDLKFVVEDRATGKEKAILHGISGSCKPGRLFALMGGSGAGKTTLLDILGCNVYSGNISGQVNVNGKPRDKAEFANISCYVTQKDMLYASATVREAITTSALLRLPVDMPTADKKQRVQEVIDELELDVCADTLVGDETIGIKGISGGQKRRVSLAIEMVKEPIVIFADEPTSGLDSEVALSIIDALRMLARKQRTVVCTIHQPNSDITDMFDDFMLLANGRAVYAGPWQKAVDWFEEQGFKTPTYKNPTDYFMSVIKDSDTAARLADVTDKHNMMLLEPPPSPTKGKGATCVINELTDISLQGADFASESEPKAHVVLNVDDLLSKTFKHTGSVPLYFQIYVLILRNVLDWVRNPVMLMAEFLQYIVIACFVGLMYMKFSDDEAGVMDRAACMWLSLAIMSFTPSYTAVTSFNNYRTLLKKELKQRQYGVTGWYVARQLVLIPVTMVQCFAFVTIMYFWVGFQTDASKFFIFFAVLSMFQFIAEGMGLLVSVITTQVTYAIVLLTFVLLLLLSFSGFLTTSIPVYFIWINKASFLTYAYTALLQSELTGLYVTTSDGSSVEAITLLPPASDNGLSMSTNIGILCAWWAGMEVVKWSAMRGARAFGLL